MAQREEEVLGDEASLVPSAPLGPETQPLLQPSSSRRTMVMLDFAHQDEVELRLRWPGGVENRIAPRAGRIRDGGGARRRCCWSAGEGGEPSIGSGERTAGGGERTAGPGEQTVGAGERTTGGGEQTTGGGERTARGGERTVGGGERTARGGERTVGGGERTARGGERTTGGGEQTTASGGQSTAADVRTTGSGVQTTRGSWTTPVLPSEASPPGPLSLTGEGEEHICFLAILPLSGYGEGAGG